MVSSVLDGKTIVIDLLNTIIKKVHVPSDFKLKEDYIRVFP